MLQNIELCGQNIEYDLQRKKVKNINLRIRSDGSISVSANNRVPMKVIEDFLRSHGEYIVKVIERCKARGAIKSSTAEYNGGEMISVLGRRYALVLKKGDRNLAELDGESLVLTVTDTSSAELKNKTAEKFMREICKMEVSDIFDRIYPEFKEWVKDRPVIKFRKMHTKWGICRPTRGEITFSYMLAAASAECIEYVVYHELCHFIHPDHSKSFYSRLSEFVPDWKERKKQLEKAAY